MTLMSAATSQLLVVDMQERLLPAMADGEAAVAVARKIIEAARRLAIPATASEQYPSGIGHTLAPVRAALGDDAAVFAKLAFSCARDEALRERVEMLRIAGRRQLVLCGVEAHVCVLQTAVDFVAAGYQVFVVADATASRTAASKAFALQRLASAGVIVVTAEMAIFEWLERAGTPAFRDVLRLLK